MRDIVGALGLLAILIVLALLGLAMSSIGDFYNRTFGGGADRMLMSTIGGLLCGGGVFACWRGWTQRQAADEAVLRFRNGYMGPFQQWAEGRSSLTLDRTSLSDMKRRVISAYGGRSVIKRLLREGFEDVLIDDLLTVLDQERAGRVLNKLDWECSSGPFWSGLIGAVAGYRWTSRG